jgi:histidinol-phosphatase (PHP family)
MTKKIIGDSHVHTTGSDGELTPLELTKLAITLGLPYFCITDHYPFPPEFQSRFKDHHRWKHFHNEEYIKQVFEAKKRFQDKVDVCFGAEFNWLEKYKDWTAKEIKKRKYDFALIAIHMVPKTFPNPVNWDEEPFEKAIKDYKGIKPLVREYYKQVRLAAQSKLFDCIAHLDIVKILNSDNKYFSETEDWYKQEVLQTLNIIADTGICMEVNSCGWDLPCKEMFPSFWILQEAHKRKIPITIGSDGHEKEQIGKNLDKALDLAKQAGYTNILKFKNRKPIEIPI